MRWASNFNTMWLNTNKPVFTFGMKIERYVGFWCLKNICNAKYFASLEQVCSAEYQCQNAQILLSVSPSLRFAFTCQCCILFWLCKLDKLSQYLILTSIDCVCQFTLLGKSFAIFSMRLRQAPRSIGELSVVPFFHYLCLPGCSKLCWIKWRHQSTNLIVKSITGIYPHHFLVSISRITNISSHSSLDDQSWSWSVILFFATSWKSSIFFRPWLSPPFPQYFRCIFFLSL